MLWFGNAYAHITEKANISIIISMRRIIGMRAAQEVFTFLDLVVGRRVVARALHSQSVHPAVLARDQDSDTGAPAFPRLALLLHAVNARQRHVQPAVDGWIVRGNGRQVSSRGNENHSIIGHKKYSWQKTTWNELQVGIV